MHQQSDESKMLHELKGRIEALSAMVVALTRTATPAQLEQVKRELDQQASRKLKYTVNERGTEEYGGFMDELDEIRTNVPLTGIAG